MGQSESNLIQSINLDDLHESTNEWMNYMEWTNFKHLKKGEKYRLIFESIEFELIFCYYAYRGKYGYHENCDAIFTDNRNYYTVDNYFDYYKFISKKEYKSKVRDKYDEKVLNIVLKQIVNDDFNW